MILALVQDPASLENLHDIVVLDAAPWWPPAPGWYLLALLVLLVAAWFLVISLKHWWRNRYRTAALKELNSLRQSIGKSGDQPTTVAALNRILKRVALAAWPRERVSQLAGQAWIDFLNQSGDGVKFSSEQTSTLRDAAFSSRISQGLTADQLHELFRSAEKWIRKHRAHANDVTSEEVAA